LATSFTGLVYALSLVRGRLFDECHLTAVSGISPR